MKRILIFTAFTFTFISESKVSDRATKKIDELINALTLEEKMKLLAGDGTFNRPAIERLGIPSIKMTDGPMGVANATVEVGPLATAFPAPIGMAATWNPDLIYALTKAIGKEAKSIGRNMLLAPCVNIQRAPHGGRNFESFSEDPYLAAEMTKAYVRGVQSEGVLATVKHFALNNQEVDRLVVNVVIDPQVADEIYFPAFKAAVDSGVGAIMSSYSQVNGTYASENFYLLKETLDKWNFQGIVVSDWGATYKSHTAQAFQAGLNIEMPWPFIFTPELLRKELENKNILEADMNQKIRKQLEQMELLGLLDDHTPELPNVPGDVVLSHRKIAYQAAVESTVLLKNENDLLPLSQNLSSIVVMGPNYKVMPHSGAGSAKVNPWMLTNVAESLSAIISPNTKVDYLTSLKESENSKTVEQASAVLLYLGFNDLLEGEGKDRESLSLPQDQIRLIEEVSQLNENVIVLVNVGGMITVEPWISKVKALLQLWYPGQEGALASVNLLFGKENPSGKLPISFLKQEKDSWAFANYPGDGKDVRYEEGIFVGYRYLDKKGIQPSYPFGYGLSYSKFETNLIKQSQFTNEVALDVEVKNISSRAGAQVVQAYVISDDTGRPPRELKAFKKLFLKAGQSKRVRLSLPLKNSSRFANTKIQLM
jgi:beta-glucosidase